MTDGEHTALPQSGPAVGLRERKKQRTREALREHALRLFLAQGYEATTIEAIAAAADVAPRTVFRYFRDKEALLFDDDYDPLLLAGLRARPVDEPALTSLRAAVRAGLEGLDPQAAAVVLARTRMVLALPSLRGRMWDEQSRTAEAIAAALAERGGAQEPDLPTRVAAVAGMAVLNAAVADWATAGGVEDLREVIDRAFDALAEAGPHPPVS